MFDFAFFILFSAVFNCFSRMSRFLTSPSPLSGMCAVCRSGLLLLLQKDKVIALPLRSQLKKPHQTKPNQAKPSQNKTKKTNTNKNLLTYTHNNNSGADGRGKHGRVPVDKEGSIPDWLNPLSDTQTDPVPSTPSTSIRSTAPPSPFPAQYVSEEGRQSREVMCPEGVTVELTSTSTHSMDTHV